MMYYTMLYYAMLYFTCYCCYGCGYCYNCCICHNYRCHTNHHYSCFDSSICFRGCVAACRPRATGIGTSVCLNTCF